VSRVEGHRWWPVLREPTVLVLTVAGIVHIIRRNPFDTILFFGTVAVIVLDRLRRVPAPGPPARIGSSRGRRRVAAAGLVLYAVIAGGWQLNTWPMKVALVVPGLLSAALITARRVEDAGAPRVGRGWIGWVAIGVAIALWELTSFILQPNPIDSSYAHPTISAIVSLWLDGWAGRTIFLLFWSAAGWWLIRTITAARAAPEPDTHAPSQPRTGPAAPAEHPAIPGNGGEPR
jgi:hypothetical protein